MADNRVFTREELREMATLTVEAVEKALEAGDTEKARKLARRMYREFLAMHDLYRDWVTALLSFIGRRYGDGVLEEALKESCAAWVKPLVELYSRSDTRRRAQLLAIGLKGHLQPLEIEEDDDKFVFKMVPCGSGGRLVQEGAYGPPRNFLSLKEPRPMTWGRSNFPVYCAHTPIMELVAIEMGYPPPWVTEAPEKIGREPCSLILYKDPQKTPSKYWERLGKKKPA